MARNALEAVFGSLGAGLRGYGQDRERRSEEEQTRLDREERARRQAMADEVQVADLLSRGFGGPREVQAQGRERAQTALQMALQGVTAGRGGMAPSMPTPTQVQQIAAQQARPERPTVNIAGRQLSLLETALERAQRERAEGSETNAAKRQQEMAALVARQKFEAEEAVKERQAEAERARLNRESAEKIAGIRSAGTRGGGRGAEALRGTLPTVTRAVEQLSQLSDDDIRALSPARVQNAMDAPSVMSRAIDKGPLEYGLARVMGSGMMSTARDREQRYALHARAVADAVARASEVGVLTNEDVNRYQRQVTLIGGESEEMKRFKVEALLSWAQWLAGATQRLNTGDSIDSIRGDAASFADSLSERMRAVEEREGGENSTPSRPMSAEEWTRQNPYDPSRETPDQYRARARAAVGGGR